MSSAVAVELRKNTGPKVPSGTTESSPRFQPWVAGGKSPEPEGVKEKMTLQRRILSSLTGLDSYSRPNPAMNRWAILERPCGTSTHDTLNTYVCEAPAAARWHFPGRCGLQLLRARSRKWRSGVVGTSRCDVRAACSGATPSIVRVARIFRSARAH